MKSPFHKSANETASDSSADKSTELNNMMRWRITPYHPLLFAVFPLLALYANNIDQVALLQILKPLGLTLAGTVVGWALLTLFTRHIRKSAFAASVVVLAFFSYRHLHNLTPTPLRSLVAPTYLFSIIVLLISILKIRRPLLDTTRILNLMSIVLLVPSCWTIGAGFWRASQPGEHIGEHIASVTQASKKQDVSSLRPKGAPVALAKSADLPDVYYIILDAYGRADRLKTFYGYDNTSFLHELEKRGFYIASHARANYNQTPLCLASALNFNYLDDLAKQTGPAGSLEASRRMLDDNKVAAYLNRLGYHYVSIGSGVGQANVETADLKLNDVPDVPLYEGQAIDLTPARLNALQHNGRYDQHRNRLLGVFSSLNTVAELPYHKFVFAHLLAPHPPFIFGSNGEAIYPKGPLDFSDGSWLLDHFTRAEYITQYIAQLKYVNMRTLEAVDSILKLSSRPPIIIIQGDHGSRMNLNWESLEKTDVREPFSILNAYYVPQKVRDDLYDTITPVNSFRILLNDVFGAKFSLIPDRSFYSSAEEPYAFKEVTNLISLKDAPSRKDAHLDD